MGIGMLLFWGLIIVVAVIAMRGIGDGTAGSVSAAPSMTPLDILRARYARGEIDKIEFEERRRELSAR